jgi:serine/threonine protein kinase
MSLSINASKLSCQVSPCFSGKKPAMTDSGQQFGKYRILVELGAGGFATVFKAIDTTLDREVALKILPHVANGLYEARANIQQVKQVLRSWGIAAADHPNDSPEPNR